MSRFHANNGEYDEWRTAELADGWRASDARADAAADLESGDFPQPHGPLPSLDGLADLMRATQARTHQETQ